VLRIVVSSDSIKNATAISHGTRRLLEAAHGGSEKGDSIGRGEFTSGGLGGIGLRDTYSFRARSIIADPTEDSATALLESLAGRRRLEEG
jgi:hypothetical protein